MYLFFAGFRGSYRPPAPPNHHDGLGDNRPDVHDEADFDIPDTQAMLERFMSNMSKLADVEYQALCDFLDSLPDPSSYTTAKTMTAAVPRENGVVRHSRVFMDFLSMDGDEVSTATMCLTTQCAVPGNNCMTLTMCFLSETHKRFALSWKQSERNC
jgi:hypothetical protein